MSSNLNNLFSKLKIPEMSPVENLKEMFSNEYIEKTLGEWVKEYLKQILNN